MIWNDQTEARLCALWRGGFAASVIAGELGTTRNAIIGKAHRLELEARRPGCRPKGSKVRAMYARRPETKPRAPKTPSTRKPILPKRAPIRTRNEYHAMLAQAWANTAALGG